MNIELVDRGHGQILVRGRLDFTTVAEALDAGQKIFSAYRQIHIDLENVDSADSAGLALLLEWSIWAKMEKKILVYDNVPKDLMAIAQISEVDQLLPIAGERANT